VDIKLTPREAYLVEAVLDSFLNGEVKVPDLSYPGVRAALETALSEIRPLAEEYEPGTTVRKPDRPGPKLVRVTEVHDLNLRDFSEYDETQIEE